MRLIDHAAARVGADACQAAGYDGAVRYLVNSPDRGLPNKILLPDEAARYLALGMPIVSNWQRGKGATADWRRGFDGGVADARDADAQHKLCGGPDTAPIFFSIDEDVTVAQWNDLCAPYLRGVASVLGKQRTGMYGGSKQCAWAIEDDLVGSSSTAGKRWLWQTRAWSNGELESAAVLYQSRIDQDDINGIGIDVNDVWADDFGQWQCPRFTGASTQLEAKPLQDPTTRVQYSPNCHDGGRDVTWIAVHTQEGNGTAASLTNYLCNPNSQVSYNAVVDDTETVLVVDWDTNPWSAANANTRADHICMAGTFVAWDRGKWLSADDSDGVDEDVMLTRTAELVAWRCIERGIPIEYVGGGSQPPDRPGICGHRDFGQWGGGHTDPGDNFPWDELIRRAQAFAAAAGGDDLSFANETIKNKAGQDINAGEMIAYLDLHINQIKYALALVLEQFAGRDAAMNFLDNEIDPKPAVAFNGWQQGGGRTLYDLSAATAAKSGVAGTADTKAPK